jgi:SAM-dependent MidA family methyltransferase
MPAMQQDDQSASVSAALSARIAQAIDAAGGWMAFDRFMAMALYEPGLGYYARGRLPFGRAPAGGSDFVTAPELSPLFGAAWARQVAQAMDKTGVDVVVEFGAGSGALAAQLLGALGDRVRCYAIVEVSGALRAVQRERLAAFGDRVTWWDALPERFEAVVVGNEVLDAMPVQLVQFDGTAWCERGVARHGDAFVFADRLGPLLPLRPPHDGPFAPGTTTELHGPAEAWIATLAAHLARGAVFLLDYGFPAAEYYHPQRIGGTLMCHRGHRADADPLVDVGTKDITAHVDFTGLALAGQDAGLEVLGYTSQAHFLLNCGLLDLLPAGDLRATADVQKLLAEHEMGELFKAIGFVAGAPAFDALGFARGDRTHTL